MCLNPLQIKNRKIGFNPYYDKMLLNVPCGHCQECDFQLQNSWVVRSWFEYVDTILKGGQVFYYTLTFDNFSLPRYHSIPCFDKKLVQDFLKRFRKRLSKYDINLRYFITSEYGETYHRPHHHVLFFIDKRLPLSKTKHGYESLLFRKLLSASWYFGFVAINTQMGAEVKYLDAIKYTAKYVSKDLSFYSTFDEDTLLNCKLAGKDIRPFHLQSRYYGLSMAEFCNEETLVKGYVEFVDTNGELQKFYIPDYIKRKLLYDIIQLGDSPCYRLNSLGKSVYKKRLTHSISKLTLLFKDAYEHRKDYYNPSAFPNHSLEQVETLIFDSCNGCLDFHDLAVHSVLFSGRYHQFRHKSISECIDFYLSSPHVDTIDTLSDYLKNGEVKLFSHPYDTTISLLFLFLNGKKYKEYTDRVDLYNSNQRVYKLKSGLIKPQVKLPYEYFINTHNYVNTNKSSDYCPF